MMRSMHEPESDAPGHTVDVDDHVPPYNDTRSIADNTAGFSDVPLKDAPATPSKRSSFSSSSHDADNDNDKNDSDDDNSSSYSFVQVSPSSTFDSPADPHYPSTPDNSNHSEAIRLLRSASKLLSQAQASTTATLLPDNAKYRQATQLFSHYATSAASLMLEGATAAVGMIEKAADGFVAGGTSSFSDGNTVHVASDKRDEAGDSTRWKAQRAADAYGVALEITELEGLGRWMGWRDGEELGRVDRLGVIGAMKRQIGWKGERGKAQDRRVEKGFLADAEGLDETVDETGLRGSAEWEAKVRTSFGRRGAVRQRAGTAQGRLREGMLQSTGRPA